MRRDEGVLLLALVALGAAAAGYVWWRSSRPPPPPPPERVLFERTLPGWITVRARKDLHSAALDSAREQARPVEAISAIDKAWPDLEGTRQAEAKLNAAARTAGLAYWVDVVGVRNIPYLLTYQAPNQ